MMKVFSLFGFIVFYLVRNSNAQCSVCLQPASVACISETEFQPCFNGGLSGSITSCPAGTVCTADSAICLPRTTNAPACVLACGSCGFDLRFACVNTTHFAYCFGQPTPSNVIGSCPSNMACRNNAANFCIDPIVTPPDCEAPTSPPPTTSGLCSGPGRFPVPGATDCRQYIYCFYYYNVLRAQIYCCQGNTIFNPAMQLCVVPSAAFSC